MTTVVAPKISSTEVPHEAFSSSFVSSRSPNDQLGYNAEAFGDHIDLGQEKVNVAVILDFDETLAYRRNQRLIAMPGSKKLLSQLKELEIPVSIITNGNKTHLKHSIKKLGFEHLIDLKCVYARAKDDTSNKVERFKWACNDMFGSATGKKFVAFLDDRPSSHEKLHASREEFAHEIGKDIVVHLVGLNSGIEFARTNEADRIGMTDQHFIDSGANDVVTWPDDLLRLSTFTEAVSRMKSLVA